MGKEAADWLLIPQVVYSQQWQDVIPRHRNPHQIHEAAMAPKIVNEI